MKVTLTTLSENTVSRPGFMAEWGLSVLIEVGNLKVLFDTGGSGVAVHNARRLGIDLSTVREIVLSHGHQDHTGGLQQVLEVTGDKRVVGHPAIWEAKYTKRSSERKHTYIGIPCIRRQLEDLGAKFHLVKEPFHLSDGVLTSGEVPMETDYEVIEENLFLEDGGAFKADSLLDDLSVFIKTPHGLVVVLGCAHRGIVNTLRHARRITGEERIHTVVGGTHLAHASQERIESTARDLKNMAVKRIGVSHCTGFKASMHLARCFDDFFLNNAGTRITV